MPPSPEGIPQLTQNATPTGAIVGVNHFSGRTGLGPSWFVFAGGWGGVEHVSWMPHPSLLPLMIRFSSSLHSGPFSVSHRFPVSGSKVNPYEFRRPYVQIRLPANGLSRGTCPVGVIRRTLPASTVRSCAFEGDRKSVV